MSTLYEIDQDILSLVDPETGEIADFERFEELQMQKDKKLEQVALWYINLLSDAEQYKAEKSKFADREQAARKRAERLKQYLQYGLAGEKFKTARVNITYRSGESVVIDDLHRLTERFLRVREPEADKTAIKEALKNGEVVDGAHIERTVNMQIK